MTTDNNAPALLDPTAASVVAPVVAPLAEAPLAVALATDATVEAPAPESVQVGNTYDYEKTGDPGLDYALGFVGKLGFGHESPAVVAAMSGDFALLRAELGSLGDKAKGYGDVVALAEQAYSRSKDKAATNEKLLGEAAVQVAGSQERWTEVQQWAAANADPAEKTAINAAFAAGGMQAKMAMEYLVNCYEKSAGSVSEPKAAVQKDAESRPGTANGPMSAREYSLAVQDLSRSLKGRDVEGHPQYRALQQRRLASQRQGS